MKNKSMPAMVIVVFLFVSVSVVALAQQDRRTVKALNGVSFSEFKGYEN